MLSKEITIFIALSLSFIISSAINISKTTILKTSIAAFVGGELGNNMSQAHKSMVGKLFTGYAAAMVGLMALYYTPDGKNFIAKGCEYFADAHYLDRIQGVDKDQLDRFLRIYVKESCYPNAKCYEKLTAMQWWNVHARDLYEDAQNDPRAEQELKIASSQNKESRIVLIKQIDEVILRLQKNPELKEEVRAYGISRELRDIKCLIAAGLLGVAFYMLKDYGFLFFIFPII